MSHPFFHGGWYFLTGSCSSCSHLFFDGLCIYFDMRTCVHPLFESFFQQYYVSFQKRLVLAMHSFKGTIIIYREYLQPSILSTVLHIFLTLRFAAIQFYGRNLLSTYFRTPVTVKQISYPSSCIFRTASIILKQEQPFEVSTFLQKEVFKNT